MNKQVHKDNDEGIQNNESIDVIIKEAFKPLFMKGLRDEHLREKLCNSNHLVDIAYLISIPTWKGDFKQMQSYNTRMRPISNDQFYYLIQQRKAPTFNLNILIEYKKQLTGIHSSPMQWATKSLSLIGRSLNDRIDHHHMK